MFREHVDAWLAKSPYRPLALLWLTTFLALGSLFSTVLLVATSVTGTALAVWQLAGAVAVAVVLATIGVNEEKHYFMDGETDGQ